jgi:2-hydroxychromene-2-carboxylate isomerase
MSAKSLEFVFDYTCPFAYLGSTQARAVAARMGVECTYRPILLGGVFKAVGTAQNLFATLSPQRNAHNLADMQRWAKRFGVSLTMPPNHPMRSVDALRATLVTKIDPNVIDGFYRAYWVENRDIASRDVISDVLTQAGHDAARVIDASGAQEIKDDLRRRTDEAVARGVFGVPTWFVDGKELYWGQDRIHFVEGKRAAHKERRASGSHTISVGGLRPTPPREDSVRSALRAPRPSIEFFWDFSSPFAYLGSTQIAAFAARTGAKIVERPILLGGLFRAIGTPDVPLATFPEAKQRHVSKDLERWAAYWSVPYRFPTRFPTMSLKALRLWYALPEERRTAFRDATFRAYWADDRDITDDAVLASCVGDEAIAREAFAKSGSDDVKAQLRATTESAAARGVFGVPTFIVDNSDLYWGQDRLELLEETITSCP